nr:aminotransferase class V-fold PLP-dependent enzyme [Sedimentibacter sp.]
MSISFETLRDELIGYGHKFKTPYGQRIITYADFTASARGLKFMEEYLADIQKCYANTHTEDDMTGEVMTKILHKSLAIIKKHFNAEKNCVAIPSGNGATGAVETFAKIVGIYIPPATRERVDKIIGGYLKNGKGLHDIVNESEDCIKQIPVVFIGPYEHHSNILMWKEGLAETVEINLNQDGKFDLDDLRRKVSDKKYKDRFKIGSFSAASNVTGVITPVYEIAKIMHENNGYVCFDYAACSPYVEINMNKGCMEFFDAVYVAPHKWVGGTGSSGLLILNERLYDNSLPPTVSGGGTVSYVSAYAHDYISNPEIREMAGTPGIIQLFKAALAIELKDFTGTEKIENKEKYYTKKVLDRLKSNHDIEILGPADENRMPIFSIKIKHRDKLLHPRFAAKLINDLFGIQMRAGCACTAPYGHRLMKISEEKSKDYRQFIKDGFTSIKPGWLRFNIHYLMTEHEVEFILRAVEFTAQYGYLFLNEYVMDLKSGKWSHKNFHDSYDMVNSFGIEESIKYIKSLNKKDSSEKTPSPEEYDMYFVEAKSHAERLSKEPDNFKTLDEGRFSGHGWFYFVNLKDDVT